MTTGKQTTSDSVNTKLAVISNDVGYIKSEVRDIKGQMAGSFVTKDEFSPVKNLVYGMTALLLSALILAIVALVVKPGS